MPFEVEICESDPEVNLDEWEHVSKGYFTIKSGSCSVFGCTDYLSDASKIEISPGQYSVLSLAKGLGSITEEWKYAGVFYKVIL